MSAEDTVRFAPVPPSDSPPWGRVDLRTVGLPSPPTVGRIAAERYLFRRGRRHTVYGESETGKSRLCYCAAVREIKAGNAVVILNGEMDDEDAKDWLLTSESEPFDLSEIEDGLFLYPSAGLLDEQQRATILADVAASGRPLTLAVVDSSTSVLAEAGLRPNDAEDIEKMYGQLGLWLTRLPDRPAFVVIDHLSKGSDGGSPTASIRKHNVSDLSLLVENEKRFSPAENGRSAVSGYSKVTIKKGRRGGRDLVVAHVIGHDSRVWLDSPSAPLPWKRSRDGEPGPIEVALMRAIAALEQEGLPATSSAVLDRAGGNRTANNHALQDLRDEAARAGSLVLVRKEGNSRVHTLTERGHRYLTG